MIWMKMEIQPYFVFCMWCIPNQKYFKMIFERKWILWLQWNEQFLFCRCCLFVFIFNSFFPLFSRHLLFTILIEKLITNATHSAFEMFYVEWYMPTAEWKRIIMNFESYAIIHFALYINAYRRIQHTVCMLLFNWL